MELLALLSGILIFIIVLILLGPFGDRIKHKRRRLEQIEGVFNRNVDEELSKPFSQRFLYPIMFKILKGISHLVPKTRKATPGNKLEKDLKLGGITLSVNEFKAIRLVVMISCISFSLLPAAIRSIPLQAKALIFLFGLVLAILVPRYYLQSSIKTRQGAIRNQLPDILDLLSVSVEAGLGFDAALLRVSDRSNGPLIDELITVHREMQMGRPRRESLKDLGERSSVGELKIFASSIIQADILGISIKNVLKTQSQQLRLSRKQRAEEKAMKAPVKMMLPLVIFIFPVIFLILLGPSLIQIMDTFG